MKDRAYSYANNGMSKLKMFSVARKYIEEMFNDPNASEKLEQLKLLDRNLWYAEINMSLPLEIRGIDGFHIAMKHGDASVSLSYDHIRDLLIWTVDWTAQNDERTGGICFSHDLKDCISQCIGKIESIDMWFLDSYIKVVKNQLEKYMSILTTANGLR